ncbi:cytochrome c oxidase assembly protein [Agromyces sp. G08B096]|uniref:Cytochrome c oxidase assembly protein n=1 Tax=Agromyces sp. G08B096 TaxID=3156399 RepID=A0AAU7W8T3_9MICO
MPEHHASGLPADWIGIALAAAAIGCYVAAVHRTRRRLPWPWRRVACWVAGVAAVTAAVVGPLADAAHQSFPAHMAAHLLIGMLAPLLLVLAAPVTLALRALAVVPARRLSALLRSLPVRFLTHPITAGAINAGGLWLLYTTDVFARMHDEPLLAAAVNVHLLLAGYLFTASMIGLDPDPHRASFALRAGVLLVVFAAHGVLAKWLVGHPPAGVPMAEAEAGGILMYYGGDVIDAVIIAVLCAQWYRATRPRGVPAAITRSA